MKIEPFLLVSTINVIIAQRLVRRLSETKEKYFLNKDELAVLKKTVDLDRVFDALKAEKIIKASDTWDKIPFYRPVPSKDDDGYKSRVGIHEVLKVTQTIKELIIKGSTTAEIEDQAKKEGMLTMIEDGIFNAVQGTTTIEEVLRVISE
jgi:type II secretory ATPase GspE/PulE/Tfp pilus assembly ATPase PilB-like protein